MNISSQPLVLPATHHHRRFLSKTQTPMFIDAAPIAVSNKIKAIQARKTRPNPLPNDSGYTDIRPLNFGYNGSGGVSNSKTNFTVWSAEKLVDRSKDIRLDRISTRQPVRPSILSTTTINQQSLLWPNYQPATGGNKQLQAHSNSTIVTPPAIESIENKSPGGKMPDIPRCRNRQPLTDRQNSELKTKSSQIPIINSPERTNNNDNLPTYDETEDEEENFLIDKEFEQYLDKAIVKCADWLIKYVFIEKNN